VAGFLIRTDPIKNDQNTEVEETITDGREE
jgi:hypothetical protein